MLRVLQVIGAMDRGGAETMLMNLYRAIDRSSIQFDFLVHEERECDYDAEISELGGKIYHLPRFVGTNYLTYKRFCRDFFEQHPEHAIVHGHIGSSSAIYLREAKRSGRYAIVHSHAQNYDRGLAALAFRMLSYPARNVADYCMACSREAGIDRFGKLVVDGSHFSILKNGIDARRYYFDSAVRLRKRSELGIAQDAFVVGHVGRLTEVKNHAFLFDVFEKIRADVPNAMLILSGRGELEETLVNDVRERGLENSIRFLGVRSDVPELLMAMDVFVFPSRLEGLPVSLIEAQASGLQCIASTGVPPVSVVTPQTVRLDLSLGADTWARKVLELRGETNLEERGKAIEYIQDAGFDIKDAARILSTFYIECAKRKYGV